MGRYYKRARFAVLKQLFRSATKRTNDAKFAYEFSPISNTVKTRRLSVFSCPSNSHCISSIMAHAALNMTDDKLTLALRIPRVGLRANFCWNGITLCVAVRVRGAIHCLHIGTVSRRESEICELAITFTTKAEELIEAVSRNQFPDLISGVEVLRERGVLHQTLTEVETVWCSTGLSATIKKEDPTRWFWVSDLPTPVEWRRDRNMNEPNE